MLKIRVIPTLLMREVNLVKGPAFDSWRAVGSPMQSVKVFNRRNEAFHSRAKGLTMWISEDGKQWNEVWQSDAVAADWTFALPDTNPVRFAKFGLKRPGILHLDRVTFYGKVTPGASVGLDPSSSD